MNTAKPPESLSTPERILPPIVTLLVAVFFIGTLLYPLCYALREAFAQTVTETPHGGETWQALANRLHLSEAELRKLNNAAPNEDKPPENKQVLTGYTWTFRHIL